MAPIGSLPPGMRGPALNGFGGPQMHQMGMAPMAPMHAMSPNMMHGPPMNPQMSQVLQSPSIPIVFPYSDTLVAKPDVVICTTTTVPASNGERSQE
jgi:hypothetical protein